jgi:ATP-binding cassette, subfamily G (WHITE), eye pigment precursor transporter
MHLVRQPQSQSVDSELETSVTGSSSDEEYRLSERSLTSTERRRRHITPARIDIHDGVTLTWQGVNCFADEKSGGLFSKSGGSRTVQKQLLFNVNGMARPGEMLAILGASGAGKTTLLNVLTCRNLTTIQAEGTIKTNGVEMGPNIKRVSAYVQQSDVFVGCLTVWEHLWFNAVLRMGNDGYTHEDRVKRVEQLLFEFGMQRLTNERTVNSQSHSGLSGSEKKLLSIASEILVDPPILFCDEPTTGLDATMAANVVKMLKKMAEKGKTVLCTIHQPASHVFEMFHQVCLMGEGRLVFLGNRTDALDFFASTGFPCPVNFNPADHFIHTLAMRPGREKECLAKVKYIERKFQDTQPYLRIQQHLEGVNLLQGDPDFRKVMRVTQTARPYAATWAQQFYVLVWKLTLDIVRDPTFFVAQLLQNLIALFIVSLLFFQQIYDQKGVMNINSSFFQVMSHLGWFAQNGINGYTQSLSVFYREHHNGMYRADTYYLAKSLADLPLFLLAVLTTTIVYFSVGLFPTFSHYLVFLLAMALMYQFSLNFNIYFIGTLCNRTDITLNIIAPLQTSAMLLCGFLVNDATIPPFINWLKYFAMHRYAFEALTVNQWKDVNYIDCPIVTDNNMTVPCYKDGNDVISFMNFSTSLLWFDLGMMVMFIVLYRILGFIALSVRAREKTVRKR